MKLSRLFAGALACVVFIVASAAGPAAAQSPPFPVPKLLSDLDLLVASPVKAVNIREYFTELVNSTVNLLDLSGTGPANTFVSGFTARGVPIYAVPAGSGGGLGVFTPSLAGLTPASGGGSTKFLRSDGAWSAPGAFGAIAANTIVCNPTGSSANPIACNLAQVTAFINVFTSGLSGAVPASGGGSTNFLRADGVWAVPASSSDRRLKGGIRDTAHGLDLIEKLHVRDFYMKDDPQKHILQGFIAQEVLAAYPFAAHAGGSDPKKQPATVEYGRLTPALWRGEQELKQLVDRQAAKIDELSRKIADMDRRLGADLPRRRAK